MENKYSSSSEGVETNTKETKQVHKRKIKKFLGIFCLLVSRSAVK